MSLDPSADADDDVRRTAIRQRLSLEPVPGLDHGPLADLKLFRATPSSGLSRLVGAPAPYWAHAWGGGLALARHLLAHPALVAGAQVLDLGTGGGLVALAAARMGARSATGVDIDPWAVSAARLNADANALAARFLLGDVTSIDLPPADLVTVGDVFYEPTLAARMIERLGALSRDGVPVLIGDPGRASLPADRLTPVARYPVADFGTGFSTAATVEGTVYRL